MILLCFGTRPEWIKIRPLVNKLDTQEFKLFFTGQHPDLLNDVNVDYKVEIEESSTNRLDSVISSCMNSFPDGDFDSVLVQGDTASAFGCAISAFNRGLKLYYLEAGLRTNDLSQPYPEEGYRQMISRISDVNLCPTKYSEDNLLKEQVSGETYVVGNTVLDNLLEYKDMCEYKDMVLITMHRRENHSKMNDWFYKLNRLSKRYENIEFILPIHPNPNVRKWEYLLTDITVVDPLEHHEFLKILVKSKLIITDSGGLQEEGSFFNKKVIVCRDSTERPEAIHSGHLHMCRDPESLNSIFDLLIDNYKIDEPCPYGDGKSAQRILEIIRS